MRAEELIKSSYGLDPQYCSHKDKMWGKAVYFALKAAYSNQYAYRYDNGNREMLLCKVLVGKSYECKPDYSLRNPPEGYTSVKGNTQDCDVYMVYKNYLSLIDCVVTYKI